MEFAGKVIVKVEVVLSGDDSELGCCSVGTVAANRFRSRLLEEGWVEGSGCE